MTLIDGTILNSGPYEPKGDHNSEITIKDIMEKVMQINSIYTPEILISKLSDQIMQSSPDTPFALISETIKQVACTNEHPEYRFL